MRRSISSKVNQWFDKYRKYLLLYRDGFWEIPFMSKSPQTVVKSVIKMPFTKYDRSKNYVLSKTPLINGGFYFEEIEEGLFLIYNELSYKSNINYIKVGEDDVEENWYLLNLTLYGVKQKIQLINGVPLTNCTWILYKPNSWTTNCHFSGAEEKAFTIYIHKDWMKKKLDSLESLKKSPIRHFFSSAASYDMWVDDIHLLKPYYSKIIESFESYDVNSEEKKIKLTENLFGLMNYFFSKYELNHISDKHFSISSAMRLKMYMVEKLLLERLTGSFPGLDFLVKEVGISETSLKINFKTVFNLSPGQYFQMKQMTLAKELLINERISIKHLCEKMGYNNKSKFAAAFKKHHGVLPSTFLR